jgi:hypothetical protein
VDRRKFVSLSASAALAAALPQPPEPAPKPVRTITIHPLTVGKIRFDHLLNIPPKPRLN